MILDIDDSKTIGDIQDRFQECFPFLKIQFYKKHKRSNPDFLLKSNQRLGDIRKINEPSVFEIKSNNRIMDIVLEFRRRLGLEARIFRQHRNEWLPVMKEETMALQDACELSAVSSQKNEEIIISTCRHISVD